MKNKNRTERSKSTPHLDNAVVIATISLVSAVCVALIGLWGIYIQNKQPPKSTQAVELETSTAELATPRPTQIPNILADVLSLYISPGCGTASAMPGYIDPFKDVNKAMSDLNDAIMRGDKIPFAPTVYNSETLEFIPDGKVIYYVTLTSQSPLDWIKLSKNVKISIVSQKLSQDLVNTYYIAEGCGAAGEERNFLLDNYLLETKYQSFTINARYEDESVPFFTLQPGEFETFLFKFQCGNPGLYQLQFQFPVEYQGKAGSISAYGPEFLCPERGAHWSGDSLVGMYHWNGSQFVSEQP